MWSRSQVYFLKSFTKKNKISANSFQEGLKAVSLTNKSEWEVRGPMETLLSALAACEVATLKALTKKT